MVGRIGAFAVLCGILARFSMHLRHHMTAPAGLEPASAPSWPPIEAGDDAPQT